MSGPERKTQIECERRMAALGWGHRRTQLVGSRGWPDTEFFKDGRVLFVEFKAPRGKQSPQQRAIAEWLARLGFTVVLARNWDDLRPFA